MTRISQGYKKIIIPIQIVSVFFLFFFFTANWASFLIIFKDQFLPLSLLL